MSKNKVRTEKQVERAKRRNEFLRGILIPVAFCGLIAGGIYAAVRLQPGEAAEEPIQINSYTGDGKPVVMENDELLFTMDPKTTQFSVEVKDTGKVWYSNPQKAAQDPLALTDEKARLQSTLLMSYSVETGLEVTYNTNAFSIEHGIYDIEQGDDYVRVNYSMGNVEKEFVIPPVITEENFLKWVDQMDKTALNNVYEYYKKYDINNLGKRDNKEELLANYPIIEEKVIYVLRDNTKDNAKKKLQQYFEEVGYTYEDFEADKELDTRETSSDKPVFNVDMIYRLEGSDLVVELPFADMESLKEYPIYSVTPLPYFGAGSTEEEGYLLLPEGGGALIHFNNGRTAQSNYYANVYGWDIGLYQDAVVHGTRAYYGLFGIAEGEDSFLCMLEDGSSYASVQADVSGKNNSYNYVNAIYRVKQREKYDVGDIANSDIYMYIDSLPEESLIQRYRFVDSGSYVDMAKEYGRYLQDRYGESLAMNSDESTPVAVEIVGAVDKVKQILGVPVSRPLKLTSYKEAAEMVEELTAAGMDNLSVKLTGWANGGVQQKLLKSVKTISDLGSKKDLQALSDTCKKVGADLYLNGITEYAMDSNILDGFFSYRDAARLISKERAELYHYSRVTYAAREGFKSYWLLHTDLAQKMADNLVEAAEDYDANVCFEDIGKDLAADYDKENRVSRETVLNLQEKKIKETAEGGTKVMVNMGNDYALPYCSMVTGMDLRGSEYTILDECVPFFQLAMHGRVNYTGDPINIGGNEEEEILYAAEYGAGLYFTLMRESAFALQKTLYTEYYGSSYDAWRDEMLGIYSRYNEELGHTFNQEMTDHANLTGTLSVTVYEDGTRVYVNYGYSEQKAEGVSVPARDYLVVRK